MDKNLKELLNTVVANDYCIGCGICASLNGSPLEMKLGEYGKYRPFVNENIQYMDNLEINALSVCPFSNKSKNETEIGEEVFGQFNGIKFNENTGYYLKNYAGYVKEDKFREKGSSGGMGNWISAQLLRNNLVDGIIHIKSSNMNHLLFEYQISYSQEELFNGAKSKYYPIELSQVIQLVKEKEGSYALIGIPCYIKAIRLLAEQDEVVKSRIKYFIGLVCGHLKSDMFAKSMGWQLGIKPKNLKSIDFRKKIKGRHASNYGVEVKGEQNGKEVEYSSPTEELYVTNWGHGLFKYNACEYCDDVLAETADVTVGDAWLPEYLSDSMGTNIITVRNPDIKKIFEDNPDKIFIEEISPEKIYQSQAGGFRHRREGLAYRLYLKDHKDEWRPQKRIEACDGENIKRKKIYEKRLFLSQESFNAYKEAEKAGDFNVFIKYMNPIIKEYDQMVTPFIIIRVLKKVRSEVKRFFKK